MQRPKRRTANHLQWVAELIGKRCRLASSTWHSTNQSCPEGRARQTSSVPMLRKLAQQQMAIKLSFDSPTQLNWILGVFFSATAQAIRNLIVLLLRR